jgi:hypothetical protein
MASCRCAGGEPRRVNPVVRHRLGEVERDGLVPQGPPGMLVFALNYVLDLYTEVLDLCGRIV